MENGLYRQSQNSGRGFVPWPLHCVHGTIRASTVPWEARGDFSLAQACYRWAPSGLSGPASMSPHPCGPSTKSQSPAGRHKSWWAERAKHKALSSLPSLTGKYKMVRSPALRSHVRRARANDTGKAHLDVQFNVRIISSLFCFQILY